MQITWDKFCKDLEAGRLFELLYKGKKFVSISCFVRGFIHKKYCWVITIHYHDNRGNEVYQEYDSVKSLLNDVRIDGKSIYENWEDLEEI